MANSSINVAEVLDRLLDKGINLSASDIDVCCPPCNPYIFASVETFLKFAEAYGAPIPCCYNLIASTETFLKFAEAVGTGGSAEGPCLGNESFSDCYQELISGQDQDFIDRILDKGIVEMGHIGNSGGESNLCLINTFIRTAFNLQTDTPPSSLAEIIDRILDKGIVVECIGEGSIMASMETYLKWREGVG